MDNTLQASKPCPPPVGEEQEEGGLLSKGIFSCVTWDVIRPLPDLPDHPYPGSSGLIPEPGGTHTPRRMEGAPW